MSDGAEKPFEPTPQRIAKAKRDGNVVRSSELSGNVSFAAGACTVAAVIPFISAYARAAIVAAVHASSPAACAGVVAMGVLPALCAAIAAIACTAAQSGGLAVRSPTAQFERLNPIDGIKRMFSSETAGRALRAAAAFTIAAGAMMPAVRDAAVQLVRAADATAAAAAAWSACRHIAIAALGTGMVFALAEYGSARRSWLRKLRMSFEERKREAKEHDGDPSARGRRATLHRALLRGALSEVKHAAFVVTNPTHVAVALAYRPPDIPVPRVTVRAADALALRVRALAQRHSVPVIENVALARALFADGSVGSAIPHAHYVAVAEIVTRLARSNL